MRVGESVPNVPQPSQYSEANREDDAKRSRATTESTMKRKSSEAAKELTQLDSKVSTHRKKKRKKKKKLNLFLSSLALEEFTDC